MNKKLSLSAGMAVIAAAVIAIAAFAVQSDVRNDSAYGFESSGSMAEGLVATDASEMANGFLNAYDGEYTQIVDFTIEEIDGGAQAIGVPYFPNAPKLPMYCKYIVFESHDAAMNEFDDYQWNYEESMGLYVKSIPYFSCCTIDEKSSFDEAYGFYTNNNTTNMMGPWTLVNYCAVYENVLVDSQFLVMGKTYEETDFNAVIDAMFKGITDPVPVATENKALGICCFTNTTADDGASAAYNMAQYFKDHYSGKCVDSGFAVNIINENTSQVYKEGPNDHVPDLYCKFTVCDSPDTANAKFNGIKSGFQKPGDNTMWSTYYYKVPYSGSFEKAYGVYGNNTGWMGGKWVVVYFTAVYDNVLVNSVFYVKGCFYDSINYKTVIDNAYDAVFNTLNPQE